MSPDRRTSRRRGRIALALALCLAIVLPTEARAAAKVAVGSGLPYGSPLIGLGFELDLGKYVAALGGVGPGRGAQPWAVGLKVSFAPPERRWRPHVAAMHWSEGNGFYLGVDHDIGRPGRFVMTYGVGFGDVNLEARFGVLIGVGYRF